MRLFFGFHICMMALMIIGASEAAGIRFEIIVVCGAAAIIAILSICNRIRNDWHWPGMKWKNVGTAAITAALCSYFLCSVLPGHSIRNPGLFPWLSAGCAIMTFGILSALNIVQPSKAEFERCCGPAAELSRLVGDSKNEPSQLASSSDTRLFGWRKIVTSASQIYFLAAWLIGVTFFWQFNSANSHGSPTPTATQTEPLSNHGHTVYITPKEKRRVDLLETLAPIGIVSSIAFAFILQFGLKLKPSQIGLVLLATLLSGCQSPQSISSSASELLAARTNYPAHWWTPIPTNGAPAWEILPQAAGPGEVILSKRNELGLLSNFAATPFTFRGKRYASLEGFWQMMKYPEGPDDPRTKFPGVQWNFTREQVAQLSSFEAKHAGDLGEKNMEAMGIRWVTFKGKQMEYKPAKPGEHYQLIVAATREKVRQNPEVKRVLLATGDLILKPDHHQEPDAPAAWHYFDILMQIRAELQHGSK